MRNNYCPFLYGKFRRFFQLAAMAVTLTAAACAGSSEQSEEPIMVDDSESSYDMASDEGSGLIIEQEYVDEGYETADMGSEATEMSENSGDDVETVNLDEYAANDDSYGHSDDYASMPVDETEESLDSTLDDAVSTEPMMTESYGDTSTETYVSDSSVEDFSAEDSSVDTLLDEAVSMPTMAGTNNFGQTSGVLPPGVIASPSAAIFIKSKYEQPSSTISSGSSSGGHSYVVVPGDTVSGISRKIYGSFGHWKKLASKNGISAPYILQPGDVIRFDADTSAAKAFVSGKHSSGIKTVKVKHGDTLSKIASALYGKSGSWKVLYNMNKSKISNPNYIQVGMVLNYSGDVSTAKKSTSKKKVAPVAAKKEPMPSVSAESSPIEDETYETINVDLPIDEDEE